MPRRPFISDSARWLEAARTALGLLKSMREGGRAERTLAGMSLLLHANQVLSGKSEPYRHLLDLGLEPRALALEQLWFDFLVSSDSPVEMLENAHQKVFFWRALGIAAFVVDGDLDEMLLAPDHRPERIAEAIAPKLWDRSRHLQVLGERAREYGEPKIEIVPLPPVGALVGADCFDALAHLDRRPEGRTVLVRGPSGVGKSTVARRLAERLVGAEARLLQIPASIVGTLRARALRELVRYLRPDVLVLDDLPVDGEHALDLLTDLEVVREPHTLVVLTQMTEPGDTGALEPGSLYHPGMRPGRIDEVVTLPAPAVAQRRIILEHYLDGAAPDGAAERTEGLTGAYLKELAIRIRERGAESLDREIVSLLAQAPIARESGARVPSGRRTAAVIGEG